MPVADLALGTDQPLGQRRLGDEECARDLRCREAAQRPQCQRDPAVQRQSRVTTREDQAQSIVGDRHVVVQTCAGLDRRQIRLDRRVAGQLVGLVAKSPTTGSGRSPDPGKVGDPHRICRDAAVGQTSSAAMNASWTASCQVEVAEDADERRDRPSLLLAEQAVDDIVGGGGVEVQPAVAPTDVWADSRG